MPPSSESSPSSEDGCNSAPLTKNLEHLKSCDSDVSGLQPYKACRAAPRSFSNFRWTIDLPFRPQTVDIDNAGTYPVIVLYQW